MAKRGRKPKGIKVQLVERESGEGVKLYAMLDELVEEYHHEIRHARIAIAWNRTWKPDIDGRCKLGQCRKASDLDRELAPFDFVVILREEFWKALAATDEQRRALLDHELCHAAVKVDADGEPVEDGRGRKVYRLRKHDVEEFEAIIARHGCYKRDLERFASVILRKQGKLPLEAAAKKPGNGHAEAEQPQPSA